MLSIWNILMLFGAFTSLANCHQKPYTKFEDSITVKNKIIFTARPPVTEKGNFVYAVCEDTGMYLAFGQRHCNVTIQDEFQKHTCPVLISDNNSESEEFSMLIFYPFGDDKVIITWDVNNYMSFSPKSSKFQILQIPTCELVDVHIPANRVPYINVYEHTVDVGLYNKTYCASDSCRITINAKGEQISGPTEILHGVNFTFHYSVGLVAKNSRDEGFYMSVGLKNKSGEHLFKIDKNGKSTKFLSATKGNYNGISTSHNRFSLCQTGGVIYTTITCLQFDASLLKLRLNTSVEFDDAKYERWVQPYNLNKGGLLLVTGKSSDVENQHYDNFSLIKIHEDGRKDEAVEMYGLNFTCHALYSFRVNVWEKESGEFCLHFVCTNLDEIQKIDTINLATKCIPKL